MEGKNEMNNLGKYLFRLRENARLTQAEASKRAGMSQGLLSKIESDRISVRFIDLKNLLAVYGLTIKFERTTLCRK